jgi:putative transposase
MIQIVEDLSQCVPVRRACQALGLSHHALYRSRRSRPVRTRAKDTPGSQRALNAEEQTQVRSTLNSERFADQAPREIYASLLDEGTYLCSVSTMYRILGEHQEVRERRDQLRHPVYAKPELLATAPNQVWTWDTPALAPQVQVLPNCSGRCSGPISTCMCCWISSADLLWAGCWHRASQPSWPRH